MPDQDLITEGQRVLPLLNKELLPLAADRSISSAGVEAWFVADCNGLQFASVRNDDPWTAELVACAVNAYGPLLDIVAEARKRLVAHEKTVERLTRQHAADRARIATLEAAQSSPLGHVVVTVVEGREPYIHGDHRRVMTVADAIRSVGRSDLPRGMTLKLCEVREVRDDA
jgi:hypothetical protein